MELWLATLVCPLETLKVYFGSVVVLLLVSEKVKLDGISLYEY